MKKLIQSKYFYTMVASFLALILSLVEYTIIAYATKYQTISMIINAFILIGLYVYAFTFKKYKSKFNILILVLIFLWSFSIIFSLLYPLEKVNVAWLTQKKDELCSIKLFFPGIIFGYYHQYTYSTQTIGSLIEKEFLGLDLNIMASTIIFLICLVCLLYDYKKSKNKEEIQIEEPKVDKIWKSPYFMMWLVSCLALIVSSIEAVVMSIRVPDASLVMIIGILVYIVLFLFCLVNKKQRKPYNLLIIVFILFWSIYAVKFVFLQFGGSSSTYYRLNYIFPCIITETSFDRLTNTPQVTIFKYVYLNWLFAISMLVMTSLILYFKEKNLWKPFFKKQKRESLKNHD